jgi:AraC family transcriptional regulator, transcriptional activator of the genes for pyochelin and ferripyochelin receptors
LQLLSTFLFATLLKSLSAIVMPLTLSAPEWKDLCQADPSNTEETHRPDSFEVYRTWQNALESGWCRDIQLRDLWLIVEEYQFQEDVILKGEPASWGPASSFFVAGTMKNCHQGLTDENLEAPGNHYLECIQEGIEIDQWFAGQKVIRVRFGLEPETLSQYGEAATFPRELQPLVNGNAPNSFYRQSTTTSEMQVVLHQILHCPYQGAMKQMYLEGKVLELAALQFSQFMAEDNSLQQGLSLKADDVDRIHHAKDILLQRLTDPPSLIELARQVGLNDCTLKRGFRQVFGKTAFGYLHDYRLEQARQLLEERQLNISEIAQTIGFASRSYFAGAFRKKFGLTPREYLSKHKNSA